MSTTPEDVRRILASIKSNVPFVQATVSSVKRTLRNRVRNNSEKKAKEKSREARTPSPARSGKRRNTSIMLKNMHARRLVQMKRNMRSQIADLENQRNELQRQITKLYTNLDRLPA